MLHIFCLCKKLDSKVVFTWENSLRCEFHTGVTFCFRIAFTCLHVFRLPSEWPMQYDDAILNWRKLRMGYPFQSIGRRISHQASGRLENLYRSEILAPVKQQGELTPVWLASAWHFVVVSCKQIQSHEREPEWTRACAKVAARCHDAFHKK